MSFSTPPPLQLFLQQIYLFHPIWSSMKNQDLLNAFYKESGFVLKGKTKMSFTVRFGNVWTACYKYIQIHNLPWHYRTLSYYLQALVETNPSMTVVLQADSSDRFFRCHRLTWFFGTLTAPVFVGDCYHFKEPTCDGVCFVLVTKTDYTACLGSNSMREYFPSILGITTVLEAWFVCAQTHFFYGPRTTGVYFQHYFL